MVKFKFGPYVVEYDPEHETLSVTGTPDSAVTTTQSMQHDPEYPVRVLIREREYG